MILFMEDFSMRVIITGGTGLIGRALSAALVAAEHEVIVLTRNPAKVKQMPARVKLEKWDGKSANGWGHLADGAGAIVNLAGESIAGGRWTRERKQRIRDSRVQAGNAVMEAIAAAAVKPNVLVQSSAVGYYGARQSDDLITESTSPGTDFLAKVSFDWEISTASAQRFGVRRPVIRTGVVLSNAGGVYPLLSLPFKLFVGGPVGSGKQWMPWVHIDDEVAAIQFLLENPAANGAFNLAAPTPVTNKEMGSTLGSVMGRPAVLPAPGFAMKIILGELSTLLLDGQRVVPQRLQELGFTFKYPDLASALRNLTGKAGPSAQSAEAQAA